MCFLSLAGLSSSVSAPALPTRCSYSGAGFPEGLMVLTGGGGRPLALFVVSALVSPPSQNTK